MSKKTLLAFPQIILSCLAPLAGGRNSLFFRCRRLFSAIRQWLQVEKTFQGTLVIRPVVAGFSNFFPQLIRIIHLGIHIIKVMEQDSLLGHGQDRGTELMATVVTENQVTYLVQLLRGQFLHIGCRLTDHIHPDDQMARSRP